MIFNFLKYLQPTHYFQLYSNSGFSVFPLVASLPKIIVSQLHVDTTYESTHAIDYDLSWQAVHLGYIGSAPTYTSFEQLSVHDNYHFIRKNFHPAWVFYVLLARLLSLHNPITELKSWLTTRSIKRTSFPTRAMVYDQWPNFESELVKRQPKISVVIPTLNRYDYLKDVLTDFEQQDYQNFEIIVVDQSEPFNAEFYSDFDLEIHVIHQKEKALWLARNTAIKAAKGDFIALSEDDVRIQPDWLSSHLKCLDFFDAQVSAGVFYPEGQEIPKERSFFALASQFATGNAMLYTNVFKGIGLFDRQFEKQRMGDGEFGMRLYLEGIRSVSNPVASCVDVKAGTGGLREMGSWDAFRPSNLLAPRPIPSVLFYFRKYYGNAAARWALLKTIPLSIMPYQFKKNKMMLVVGVVLSVLLVPLVMVQVWRSWLLASVKLKEGAKIEKMEA